MLQTFFTRHNSMLDNLLTKDYFDNSILSGPKSVVKKEEDSWKILISLVGYTKEDLNINATDDTICISGEISEDVPSFVPHTKFKRSWVLENLDADSIEAKLESGILEVTLRSKESEAVDVKNIDIK